MNKTQHKQFAKRNEYKQPQTMAKVCKKKKKCRLLGSWRSKQQLAESTILLFINECHMIWQNRAVGTLRLVGLVTMTQISHHS